MPEADASQQDRIDAREQAAGNAADQKTKTEPVDCFELDKAYLDGLVGVETGNPHRPGLSCRSSRTTRLRSSTTERWRSCSARLWHDPSDSGVETVRSTKSDGEGEASDVFMHSFNSTESEAIHDSLDILKNNPVNRTVLCTVDEFSKGGS